MTAETVDRHTVQDDDERWSLSDAGLDHHYRTVENKLRHALDARDRAARRVIELQTQLRMARELQDARIREKWAREARPL